MNAAKSYAGPDRRIRDDAVEDLREHLDKRMDEHRLHVDRMFSEIAAKLDPIHEHYVMVKRGGSIVAWLATIGAGAAGAWATLKGSK